MVDSHIYQILLRLHKRLASEKSGWVGIADAIFGEYFGIFSGNAHPTRGYCSAEETGGSQLAFHLEPSKQLVYRERIGVD
jgi:hypothetical protein